ncbi:hypothetical protein [Kangiella sp.]|uniref:hypothetical protein n=1 Tax=Kangiella sp. TaxID=1920245 RepID=UPI003A8D71A0
MSLTTTAINSVLTTALKQGISYWRKKRINELLEKLKTGGINLDSPEVEKEEFISTLIYTADALQKASGHQKINYLIDIFVKGAQENKIITDTDEVNELLSSISELSNKEIIVLSLCSQHLIHSSSDTSGKQVNESSEKLYKSVSSQLNISFDESISVVAAIQRTGFIVPYNQPGKYPYYLRSYKMKTLLDYIHLTIN